MISTSGHLCLQGAGGEQLNSSHACTALAVTARVVATVFASASSRPHPSCQPDLNLLWQLQECLQDPQEPLFQCRAWCACEALLQLCLAAHMPIPAEVRSTDSTTSSRSLERHEWFIIAPLQNFVLGLDNFSLWVLLLQMVESLASAVEDALKQASAQAIQPPCVFPALCVAEMLCGLQAKRLAENIVQVVEICQRNLQVCMQDSPKLHVPLM